MLKIVKTKEGERYMKKLVNILLILLLSFTLITGCTTEDTTDDEQPDTTQTETQNEEETNDDTDTDTDTETGLFFVKDEASIQEVMGTDGSWIVIFTEDMTTDEELVLEGTFENNGEVVRKVKLLAQDENRNKTDSYTLTAPKITIKSENASIEGGTFKGDVYVEANGFKVIDATIDGNVYFTNDEYQSSYETIDGGKVTGVTEVQ